MNKQVCLVTKQGLMATRTFDNDELVQFTDTCNSVRRALAGNGEGVFTFTNDNRESLILRDDDIMYAIVRQVPENETKTAN